MAENVGERFAISLLARDWEGVKAVLDPAVEFRGLTPGRLWEAGFACPDPSGAGSRLFFQRVVPGDAGHRGQRVLPRLSSRRLPHRRDRNANPRRLGVSAAYLTASQRPSSKAAPAVAIAAAMVIRVTTMLGV
jgi:hypothetical protein